MKKIFKNYLLIIGILTLLLIIPNCANATETFTTGDGIVATKIVENTEGTIDFKLTNINLSTDNTYSWSISTTSNKNDIKKWFQLGPFDSNKKIAVLSATSSDSYIRNILKTTNNAWIYLKNNSTDTYIIDALKVDLTLPVLNSVTVSRVNVGIHSGNLRISRIYDIDNCYYYFQKITDKNLIEKYNENNGDLTKLALADLSAAPTTGWKSINDKYYGDISKSSIPTEDGLYYLWIKQQDSNSKPIITYTLHKIDVDAPIVKSISVESPASGTYNTSQTVKIRVYFDEKITGTTVPILKIKFGESSERSISNGTIKNDYIEYSYNIQSGDNGQLATVSLTGGTIKDAAGHDAKLSCPLITGNTIKANTEGVTNNTTDNQDKNNNTTNKDDNKQDNDIDDKNDNKQDNNQNNSNNNFNNENKNNSTNSSTDTTVAGGKIPQTGATITFGVIIVSIIGICIFAFKKYLSLRDI